MRGRIKGTIFHIPHNRAIISCSYHSLQNLRLLENTFLFARCVLIFKFSSYLLFLELPGDLGTFYSYSV